MSNPLWESFREGCGTCVYWDRLANNAGVTRQCRRHPPVVLVLRHPNADCDMTEQHQPWVSETEWCGEYKREMPRDPAPAA